MAPRKPTKSQKDKPSDSLSNQVGAWLGGAAKGVVAGPTQLARNYAATLGADAAGAARGVQSWSESQARTFTNPYINAAGRVIGKNPNLPVSGAKEAITNTAFGAVDVAAGPIGRVAAKGATAAVRAVANTGVPARLANTMTGQKVVVVGTKSNPVVVKTIKGREFDRVVYSGDGSVDPGKFLPTVPDVVKEPQKVFAELKNTPVRWGFDPSKSKSMADLTKNVTEYSNRWQSKTDPKKLSGGGSTLEFGGYYAPKIAVAKVPKKSVRSEPVMPRWDSTPEQIKAINELFAGKGSLNNPIFEKGAVASTSPAKVVSVVSPSTPNQYGGYKPKSPDQVERELAKAIKRAGGKLPKKK